MGRTPKSVLPGVEMCGKNDLRSVFKEDNVSGIKPQIFHLDMCFMERMPPFLLSAKVVCVGMFSLKVRCVGMPSELLPWKLVCGEDTFRPCA